MYKLPKSKRDNSSQFLFYCSHIKSTTAKFLVETTEDYILNQFRF